MKTAILAVIVVSGGLTGCTKMEHYYTDARKVMIDGEEFVVAPKGEGQYLGVPNDVSNYSVIGYEGRAAAKNVRAIEAVTGCKVLTPSIHNTGPNTMAAVSC